MPRATAPPNSASPWRPAARDALHLAHTGDNFGPPSVEDVEELFAQLQAEYPGARIIASTLDAFAAAVLAGPRRSCPCSSRRSATRGFTGSRATPC